MVTDHLDRRIGQLVKDYERSLVRSTWWVLDGEDREVAWAQERSVPVAVWRRAVDYIPVVGQLLAVIPVPYHFDVYDRPGADRVRFGGVRRRVGLRDRYVMDVSGDTGGRLDRRLAIALAVGLDALGSR